MNYRIIGDTFPAVEIGMNKGEKVITEAGGMSWMTSGINMETSTNGGMRKGFKRALAGESMFQSTYTATQDDLLQEHLGQLTYDVEVYSNRTDGKKAECRAITGEIDKYMHRMNFARESAGFVPNLANNSIARLVSKYSVLASETHFYRR